MMVFALGVVAMASVVKTPTRPALPPSTDTPPAPADGCSRPLTLPALAYHTPFSLN
jgi:hypothetical protein